LGVEIIKIFQIFKTVIRGKNCLGVPVLRTVTMKGMAFWADTV
jgi:hypothetical protein